MLLELIKLPLRLAAIPALLALLALQLLGVILIGLSSVVTHLLASVFLLGAVAGWLVHAQSWMVFIRCTHSIWFSAFSSSVTPSCACICRVSCSSRS